MLAKLGGVRVGELVHLALKFELAQRGDCKRAIVLETREFVGGQGRAVLATIEKKRGGNEKRDAELRTAQAHLEKHGPIRNVHLKKSGNTYYLETVAKSRTK